jgi:phage shock protein C
VESNSSKTKTNDQSTLFEVSDRDLESTLEHYLEERVEAPAKPSFMNFFTVSGLAILMTGFFAVVQLFLPFSFDFTKILNVVPLVGGIIVMLVGLGFFNSEYRKSKSAIKRGKTKEKPKVFSENTGSNAIPTDPIALKQKKKLFKSRRDKRIAGVCGGLADYFGVDATLVRIAFVALFFLGSGSPAFVYIALSFLLDKEPKSLNK